ncbi:MAG: ATP-dependent helicase, partial [Betaproteobacteria bacterium]
GLRIIKEALSAEFNLFGREEQAEFLKSLTKGSAKKAQQAAEKISRIKNSLEDFDEETRKTYEAYQAALKQNNTFDFDDLILTPIKILENNPPVKFKNTFTHIMVDEYQDINPAQYTLIRLLAQQGSSLCAIGDSDQAIYGFRGADAGAFLSFDKDFKNAATIKFTRNYRSTGVVLSASNSLIRNNQKRIEKDIVPTKEQGSAIRHISAPDERAEGEFIVREIEARIGGTSHHRMRRTGGTGDASGGSFRFSDFAVIFRTNAQARAIEEAFRASGIPYQVIGRRSSLQAREIGETIAYLQSLIKLNAPGDTGPVDADANEAKLLTTADYFDPRADAVILTTLHTAKGLEFKIVFIAGCEQGLIPYTGMKDDTDVEEERRLFYVGMTRAKNVLFLLHARQRFLYGQRTAPSPSPFLKEIPDPLIKETVIPDKVKKQKEPDKQMGLF